MFFAFSFLTILCALLVILLRTPLSSAFFLILSFVNLAGIYVLLDAHFLAAAQILVYAGAIMVLFIFVIMLLHSGKEQWGFFDQRDKTQVLAGAMGLATLGCFAAVFGRYVPPEPAVSLPAQFGNLKAVAAVMFSQYFVAFELVSVLLLVAIVGAVLLAKRVI